MAVASQWGSAGVVDPGLLRFETTGDWWGLLAELDVTLLVSREYEHLIVGLSAVGGRPHATYLPLPHPSGIAVDRKRGTVWIASTRNPNQLFALAPAVSSLDRLDAAASDLDDRPLLPVSSRLYPGALYLHDLVFVGGELHGNAVGQNAIVSLDEPGRFSPVWWPRSIERAGRPDFRLNYLQLNSIAAGRDLASSFFSASATTIGRRRPGHLDFAVDGRGAIFSGESREPVVLGLTRPHSARFRGDALWVANSGYGEVGPVVDRAFSPVRRFTGWTRGLCFCGDLAFVGLSRILPRFRRYAPGVDADKSECSVHAIDGSSGATLASIRWPRGNQIFSVEAVPTSLTRGFVLGGGRRAESVRRLFYSFSSSEGGA